MVAKAIVACFTSDDRDCNEEDLRWLLVQSLQVDKQVAVLTNDVATMPSSTPNHPRRSNMEYSRYATRHAATTHTLIDVLKNSGASVSRPWLSLSAIALLCHVGVQKNGKVKIDGHAGRMVVDIQDTPSSRWSVT